MEYDNGNVYLLNNAIDIEKFKFNKKVRTKKRAELKIDDETIVIGHIGRFVETKKHLFLIQAFNEIYKKNKKVILLLIGQGPLYDRIKSKVRELNLENAVIFLGQRNDVNELYQVFDLFYLPSLYKGLQVVGIEAQISGLPCIFSNKITNKVKVNQNVYFYPINKTDNWVEYATNTYKNSKHIVARNNGYLNFINSCFNIKTEAKKLENI